MLFQKKFSVGVWLRACISLTFFLGGAAMLFWAQGFRFDFSDRKIVSTGVISVSSIPKGANIYLNSVPAGTAPDLLLGVPLGTNEVCLQKDGRRPFCDTVRIDKEEVQHIYNVALLPHETIPLEWGAVGDFLWDSQGRGFIRLFHSLSSAVLYDNGTLRFLEPLSSNVYLTSSGTLLTPFVSEQKIFSSKSKSGHSSEFLPDRSGFLYIEGNILSLRIPAEIHSSQLAHFSEPINNAFFLPESESIIVSTPTDIAFIARPGQNPKKLFQKDSGTEMRYFPQANTIFWEHKGVVYSFTFE